MKPHFKLNVKFCPCCGMPHIQPDELKFSAPQHRALADDDYEYVCQMCGFGFRITRSNRTRFADMIFKEVRSLRRERSLTVSSCASPEIAENFVKYMESKRTKF